MADFPPLSLLLNALRQQPAQPNQPPGPLPPMLPGMTDQQRFKGTNLLRNAMYGAIDPSEGDYYRGDMYNLTRAAEGIRKYQGDK
jgi:hypothetical protein